MSKETDLRMEREVYEITVGSHPNAPRYAIGNYIRLPKFGSCTIDEIVLDNDSYHMNGFSRWIIILKLEDGTRVFWRTYPVSNCIVTYDIAAQV